MPTYNYKCPDCGSAFEGIARISQSSDPKPCTACGGVAQRAFTAPENGFVLNGSDWPGKNLRVRNEMQAKNERLDRKQAILKRERPGLTLAPNVGGERVESWSDATKLAASKKLDTSGYEALARKESAK